MNTVALFTSAWIETLLRLGQRPMSVCRTLHECVDWNPCWCCRVCDCYRVALFTSAWIETSYEEHAKPISESRTLHECVDWNKRTLTKAGLLTGRTLHECVDWNPWHENWATGCRQSHSSRVRGLRLMFISTSSQNNEDFWTYSLKRKKISSKENTWPKWVCPYSFMDISKSFFHTPILGLYYIYSGVILPLHLKAIFRLILGASKVF